MKITDLTNEEMDILVAKAQGWKLIEPDVPLFRAWRWARNDTSTIPVRHYQPSTNWQQACELVEKFEIWSMNWNETYEVWDVTTKTLIEASDKQLTRAICLAVIASVYGEEVDGDE